MLFCRTWTHIPYNEQDSEIIKIPSFRGIISFRILQHKLSIFHAFAVVCFLCSFFPKTKSLRNNIGVLNSLDLDQESLPGSKLFVNVYQQTIKVAASKERLTSLI